MAEGDGMVSIRDRLLKERQELLDLSTRNRLLNTPLRTRNNRAIEIVDERASDVFRFLVEGKSLIFLPGAFQDEPDTPELGDDIHAAGPHERAISGRAAGQGGGNDHADFKLQTRLTRDGLQNRLFDIWDDARTLEEEQGVNILYLAIGLLRWYDKEDSEVARHAPLVLLPVRLERSTAADRFKLKTRHEPPSPNLSLQAKLDLEFGLKLEDFPDEDALDLPAYIQKVSESVSKQPRWEVLPDAMVLGFFSFAKFLMYRDLDPKNWPTHSLVDAHPLICSLLRDGFPESEQLVADDAFIDPILPISASHHVVDADSSQAVAIAEAVRGRTMVIKGPPGTGKSQTITNIIAGAAAAGKKVLFVAEKMAALEVVHRRLQNAGLGALTLELHSNKSNKKSVLEELRRTKETTINPLIADLSVLSQLDKTTEALNKFAAKLHERLTPCGLTPHQILGRLIWSEGMEIYDDYHLNGAADWAPHDVAERRRLVSDISERLINLGPPPSHPWRGIRRGAVAPQERSDISRRLSDIIELLTKTTISAALAQTLGTNPVKALRDMDTADATLGIVASLPPGIDRLALAHPLWVRAPDKLRLCVEAGEMRARTEAQVAETIMSAAWTFDFETIRLAIATKGSNPFRFLSAKYRMQVALLKSLIRRPLPRSAAMRLALIDKIVGAQQARRSFEAIRTSGIAFGNCWKGEDSDWALLHAWVKWREEAPAVPEEAYSSLATAENVPELVQAAEKLAAALPKLNSQLSALFALLQLDLGRAFSVGSDGQIAVTDLKRRLVEWQDDMEGLTRFIAFAERGREAASVGLSSLMEAVQDGNLGSENLLPAFERSYARTLQTVLFTDWPELRAFDGDTRNQIVAWFRQLDRQRIELAKKQIASRHAETLPHGAGGIGPLGVLNAEIAKKKGRKPLRKLLKEAGPAIQQLKPVFMMSPLSVAQYLEPGALTFDILVMDEASQIEPVDALGAVARAHQLVVVGDEKQLPPTAFFKKLAGDGPHDGDSDDGLAIQAKDAESILDLCLAKGAPHRMLNWHYRSKHQSLIAVSNMEFYENKLFIVPSPYDATAGMGLKFHLLRNAPYDRGGSRTNPVEARVIAEAVIRHARDTPGVSLGVATFSVAQRQAIQNQLELLRRAQPDLEDFFGKSSIEPFFVKNLENIQGDERDVIFISVGYGKTEQGFLAHAFGPLSLEGGERRLNVLISRAKIRCEIFCNFTGADIDPERTRARGVMALRMFLTFAETGTFGLGEETGMEHDSEFERQVALQLRGLGYDVRAQIGASGFRVDLAICDSEKPGRFVLGIECDGAQYHSSRSARDRDRLRQQVLEAHGWIIHRIWGADWYLRPKEELRKVEAAVAAARVDWRRRDKAGVEPEKPVEAPLDPEPDPSPITEPIQPAVPEPTSIPYIEASFPIRASLQPHEAPEFEMLEYVVKIVAVEGPIHIDEIARRICYLWGLGKTGSRIQLAVERATARAAKVGRITGNIFYTLPGHVTVVRNRENVNAPSLRKPEMLPPVEIDTGISEIVGRNFGAPREQLIVAVARAFGFAKTSAQLRSTINARVIALMADGQLIEKGGLIVTANDGVWA